MFSRTSHVACRAPAKKRSNFLLAPAVFLLVALAGFPSVSTASQIMEGGPLFPAAMPDLPDPNSQGTLGQTVCTPEQVDQQTACSMSNGVALSIGSVALPQVDFQTHQLAPFSFVRNYNCSNAAIDTYPAYPLFGYCWYTTFDMMLELLPQNGNAINAFRSDGSFIAYKWNSSAAQYQSASPDADTYIVTNGSGYTLHHKSGAVENYNSSGRLLSFYDAHGIGWTLNYGSSTQVQSATNTNGQTIKFTWTGGVVTAVTDPAGNSYGYNYDYRYNSGLLTSVTYPNSHTISYSYWTHVSVQGATNSGPYLSGVAIDGATYLSYSYRVGSVYLDNAEYNAILTGSTGPAGSYTYSAGGSTSATTMTVTNSAGAVTVYSYPTSGSSANKLSSIARSGITNVANTTATTTYDSNGNPQSSTDQRGYTNSYTYSSTGLVTDIKLDSGEPANQRETQYTWNTSTNQLLTKEVLGPGSSPISLTTYSYTGSNCSHNYICSITVKNLSSNGVANQTQTTTYAYQFYASGIPSEITISGPLAGPGGYVLNDYDQYGNLTSSLDANGNTTTYSNYTALGQPKTITDPNGFTVNVTYDSRGNVLTTSRTVDGVSGTTTYTYNGLNEPLTVTYADNGSCAFGYDAFGRLTSVSNNIQNSSITYSPNAFGDITAVSGQTGPSGSSSVFYSHSATYDSVGRILSDLGNNGQNFQYSYDENGNRITATDSLGQITNYTYNAFNQVSTVKDAVGNITQYEYDGEGSVSSVTDAKGNVTSYLHDGFGHITSQSSPDTGTTTYGYNSAGLLTWMLRSDGVETSYGYDALNRLSKVTASGVSESLAYDTCTNGKTRLCSITYPSGSTSYTYRLTGQYASQTSVISGYSYTLSWAYDNRDRMTGITYPDGSSVSYSYNGQSEVTGITATVAGTAHAVLSNAAYYGQGLGPLHSYTMGDGSSVTLSRDLDLRLAGISAAGSSTVESLSYGYDKNNNITGITNSVNSGWSQTIGYDADYRVKSSASSGLGNLSINYDGNGNRSSDSVNGTYTINPNNNQVDSTSGLVSSSWNWNSVGNLHSYVLGSSTCNVGYDAFYNMSSLSCPGETYVYNAMHQRTSKAGSSGTYYYVYGPDNTLYAESAQNSASIGSDYIYLAGQPIALIRGGALYYIHDDHLGRPDTVTNSSATVVWRASDTAFGRNVSTNSIGGLNLGFPGQYYDSESGFWYNGARYYDSAMGRYLQSDPIGLAGGTNTYAYALNSPTTLVDPTGLDSCDDERCTTLPDQGTGGGGGSSDGMDTTILPPLTVTVAPDPGPNPVPYSFSSYGWLYGTPMPTHGNGESIGGSQVNVTGRRQCIQTYLRSNYGNFVANSLVPTFAIQSYMPGNANFGAAMAGVEEGIELKGGIAVGGYTVGAGMTAVGLLYPTVASDGLVNGGIMLMTGTGIAVESLPDLVLPVAAFATTADLMAQFSCLH